MTMTWIATEDDVVEDETENEDVNENEEEEDVEDVEDEVEEDEAEVVERESDCFAPSPISSRDISVVQFLDLPRSSSKIVGGEGKLSACIDIHHGTLPCYIERYTRKSPHPPVEEQVDVTSARDQIELRIVDTRRSMSLYLCLEPACRKT